jgi:predicted Fe-Mo cluster-binding NifX family protein
LGGAPYFYLIRINAEGHIIQEERILPRPYLHDEKGKGIKVSEWLLQNGVNKVLTRNTFDGKGRSYVFSSGDMDVIVTETKTIEEVCQNLKKIGTP